MKNINKCKEGIIYLISISIISFAVYYLLWLITDVQVIAKDGFTIPVISRNYLYSLLLTTLTLLACHGITAIPFFHKKSICHIVLLIFIIFTVSLIIAQGVGALWNYHVPVSRELMILDAYFLSIITTMISAIFISKYYCDIMTKKNQTNNRLRMKVLKSQIDPHFMFNSLNTLAELIHENPKVAEDFTIHLSNVYRYVIRNFDYDVVSVRDAIFIAREYCKLLELRYPKNFIIHFDTEINDCKGKVLPLGIQQLVENAIKHNRHSSEHPLEISFTIDDRYITVSNKLSPLNDKPIISHGIGLSNLKDRYRILTKIKMEVNKSETRFEVKLPIITNYENTDN